MAKKKTSVSSNGTIGRGWEPATRGLTDVRSDGSRVASHGGRYTSHRQTYMDIYRQVRRERGLATG